MEGTGGARSTAGRAGEGFLHQHGSTVTLIGNNSKNSLFLLLLFLKKQILSAEGMARGQVL